VRDYGSRYKYVQLCKRNRKGERTREEGRERGRELERETNGGVEKGRRGGEEMMREEMVVCLTNFREEMFVRQTTRQLEKRQNTTVRGRV